MINGAAFPLVSTATGNRIAHRNSAARPSERQGRTQRGRVRERERARGKREMKQWYSLYKGNGWGSRRIVPVPEERENRDFREDVG